jgi:NAD+ diphosphatase
VRFPFTPLVDPDPDHHGPSLTVVVRGHDHVALLEADPDEVAPGATRQLLGRLGDVLCWAIDLDGDGHADVEVAIGPAHAEDLDEGAFLPLMGLWGRVDEPRWTLAGRAVQLVAWDRTHRYCGRCATPTEPVPGERARRCPACGLLAYPRLVPAVIVLVERDGEALLARGRQFPIPMYSCLAGFVEPGETLEQAVAREVHEEVGIEVADIAYAGSQPWPFPHSLMIGFTARWAAGDIVCDEAEIVDAGWYRPDDLPMIPPGMSIARTLIDAWVARSTPGHRGGVA